MSLLLLWVAGCASQRLVVPDEDWQTVPAKQRTAIDARHQADLTAARAERQSAATELAAFRRNHPTIPAPVPAPASALPAASRDSWDNALRDHEQARRAAFTRVENDKVAWLRADLAWRALRLDAAEAQLDMVTCEREAVRARTIDRNLLGTDSYDSAPMRGQFSRAQQRWYKRVGQTSQARDAYERAGRDLASSKESYAQLMRNGPGQLRSVPAFASDDRPRRLELASWVVTRSDIRRRRGLRRFLDEAAIAPPRLRRATVRLAARAVVLPVVPARVVAMPPPPPSTAARSRAVAARPPAVAARPPAVAAKAAAPAVAAKPMPAVAAKPAPIPASAASKPAPPPASPMFPSPSSAAKPTESTETSSR